MTGEERLDELVGLFGDAGEARLVLAGLLNAAAEETLPFARNLVARRTGLPAATVDNALRVYPATHRHLRASISIDRRTAGPLYNFAPRPDAPEAKRPPVGVSVLNPWTRQRETVPESFIARMPSGHVGVFERLGEASLPIRELYWPSLAGVFGLAEVKGEIEARLEAVLDRKLKEILQ